MNAEPTNVLPRPRRHLKWPLIVVGLLTGHVSVMIVAVVIATHDKSFAVLPDYYQKAVHWDQGQAELRASERLGWQCAFTPSPEVDPLGRRSVTFTLVDSAGRGIPGVDIRVTYFHHARPAELFNATLRTDDAGRATQPITMRNQGFWQVNVTATKAGQKFVQTTTPFVSTAKRGPT
jgi:nitrogen fixation protein FixH